jgi:hypothetical protein
MELLPGPPFNQSPSGAVAGDSLASKNQKNICEVALRSMYPAYYVNWVKRSTLVTLGVVSQRWGCL